MGSQNLPATQKANTIRNLFEQQSVKKQLALAVPRHLSVDRLLRVAMTSIQRTPKLLDCTQQSLLACVMTCAQLGLEPDAFLGQAYLVPYWNGKKSAYEAQLIPGYRGYIALARRYLLDRGRRKEKYRRVLRSLRDMRLDAVSEELGWIAQEGSVTERVGQVREGFEGKETE